MDDPNKSMFLGAAIDWVCNPYTIDIRYIARKVGKETKLMAAAIGLAPLPLKEYLNFGIEAGDLYAGQVQMTEEKGRLLEILKMAAEGKIQIHEQVFTLQTSGRYNYYSDVNHRELWYYDLHLEIRGDHDPSLSPINFGSTDNALRQCSIPFDGLSDLTTWLGLMNSPLGGHESPSINIRVLPPVDIVFPSCRLEKDHLHMAFEAHPAFELDRFGLAVRAVPGNGMDCRKQVSSTVRWQKRTIKGKRKGAARIPLKNADNALTMLSIGETTVRRQWFLDPVKGTNNRLKAVQCFDKDLRATKAAIFEPTNSKKFEQGVAALLFLLGFSPAPQIETDSPDIVVATPTGRLVLVECTTRIADFHAKVGKLVDRKAALTRALQEGKNQTRVDAVLAYAPSKEQLPNPRETLKAHQIILIAKEEFASAFDQLRFHLDPDKLIDDGLAQLARGDLVALGT